MIDVEVFDRVARSAVPPDAEVVRLCARVAERCGVREGHVAVEFVDSARIAQLNGEHRGKPVATDVLSFPIDGPPGAASSDPGAPPGSALGETYDGGEHAPVELGDIVICPEHTVEVREAVVHGMLHLLGMDHETDAGEMLALQGEILAGER